MNATETPFVEAHTMGDGHFHECASCTGTIGESDAMVFVDGEPMHAGCWES
jgi:hypothetical protein